MPWWQQLRRMRPIFRLGVVFGVVALCVQIGRMLAGHGSAQDLPYLGCMLLFIAGQLWAGRRFP